MSTSVVVDGVAKRFRIANQLTLKRLAINAVKRRKLSSSFNALEDISFTLQEGDTLALLGLNGSGKSTLLKLIAGVMSPDEGEVLTRGRIAGLIEVGAGLHPDLTGRENIYLSAAIMGMSEAEIDRKFDQILDFTELEQHIESPVRHYSSGMFVRLGFSVAVHTDCDIFLIDEVLAVGDQPFKRKCMNRIRELRDEGRTMVYVTHNPKQAMNLCERGVVLEKGRMTFEGSSAGAVKSLGYDVEVDEDDDVDSGTEDAG